MPLRGNGRGDNKSRWPVREATSRDLRVDLTWTFSSMQARGRLTAYNRSSVVVSISGKPLLYPVLSDDRMRTRHVTTADEKRPPYVVLAPRETAVCDVTMFGWGGSRVRSIIVELEDARFELDVHGFRPQPEVIDECVTSSEWWTPLDH